MADRNNKLPENVPGAYYVDDTCVDCNLCCSIAPQFFIRQDNGGYSYVYKQPLTSEEVATVEEVLKSCPTETIGNDG